MCIRDRDFSIAKKYTPISYKKEIISTHESKSKENWGTGEFRHIQKLHEEILERFLYDIIIPIQEEINSSVHKSLKRENSTLIGNIRTAVENGDYYYFRKICTTSPSEVITELERLRNIQIQLIDLRKYIGCVGKSKEQLIKEDLLICLLYTSPSPRDRTRSRMPSSA